MTLTREQIDELLRLEDALGGTTKRMHRTLAHARARVAAPLARLVKAAGKGLGELNDVGLGCVGCGRGPDPVCNHPDCWAAALAEIGGEK